MPAFKIFFPAGDTAMTQDLKIIPLTLCYYMGEKGYMTYMAGYGNSILRPFVTWLIQGAEKNILVDSAIEMQDYQGYHSDFRDLEMTRVQSFDQALASVGLEPQDIDLIVQTQLHFDHCANTKKCPNAQVLVQRTEYECALDPGPFQKIYRKEYFEGADLVLLEGEHELAPGITLLPTPGHTAGGQSVLVETKLGTVAIAGMCTCLENFFPGEVQPLVGGEDIILPGILWEAKAACESMKLLKDRADRILALHDPELLELSSIP